MPQYTYRNKDTGQVLTLEGERPPTEQELDQFFSQMPAEPAPAPVAAPAAAPAPEAPKAGSERGIGTTIRELATSAGAGTAGQAIGTAVLPGVGTVVGGAVGAGAGNLANQLQRRAEDPNYKFRWGEFLSEVGTGAIPGGALAKTGVKAVAREAAKQAAGGLGAVTTQKLIDESTLPTAKEALLATVVPAVAGGAAQKLLSGAAPSKAAVAAATRRLPKETRTLEAGAAKGLKIVPSDVDPSFTTTQLESIGGKTAVSQRIQLENQDAVNNMIKEELRIPRTSEISPDALRSIREQESKVYQKVDAMAEKARKDLEKIDELRRKTLTISDPAERAIEEAKFNAKYAAKETKLKEQAAASLEDLRKARGDAQRMWDSYFTSGGKNVEAQLKAVELTDKAEKLALDIDATLRRTGNAALADRVDEARKRIAQTYDVAKMLNPGNFNIDPDVAARLYRNNPNKLSGNLKLLAEFKLAFPNSLREVSKVTSPDVSLLGTFAQGLLGSAVGGATGNIPGALAGAFAVPAARKGAREYLLSSGVQRRALEAAKPQAKEPLAVGTAAAALRQTGQQVGQEPSAQAVPTEGAIAKLREDPSLAKEFDDKYGYGSSKRYLKNR